MNEKREDTNRRMRSRTDAATERAWQRPKREEAASTARVATVTLSRPALSNPKAEEERRG